MNKFENYEKCLEYLFDIERTGIKYDLKNIRLLLDFSGNPQNSFDSIHIAGTNGKGSVAAILYSVLAEKYLTGEKHKWMTKNCRQQDKSIKNIGLYTSPHIVDFRERILVNCDYISKSYIINFINRIYNFIRGIDVSFFEITTALAFNYFRSCSVRIAVIETGLGGRLDSTNILKPIISVITGISYDHTEYLGDSLKSIAIEKAGIIKKNTPCIVGKIDNNLKGVISREAKKKNAEVIFSDRFISIKSRNIKGFSFNSKYKKFNLKNFSFPIIGDYQRKNISTALSVLEILEKRLNSEFPVNILRRGFKNILSNSKLFGRFQTIISGHKVILDISHNTEGLRNIERNLKYFKYNNLFIIFGIMKDKNYRECLKVIKSLNALIILTKADYKRALEPKILFYYVKNLNKFVVINTVKDSYRFIRKIIKKDDLLLVTGSFFIVSDFLKAGKIKLVKYQK